MTTAPTYADASATSRRGVETATVGVLIALSASHMLNDVMQSLAPALYPVFHERFALSFFQIGLITFVFQLTASFLQPLIGLSLDKRPLNFILPAGMAFTLVGLVLLALANSYLLILLSVGVVGIGSAVFHPEASRVARAASGGRHGFAQSLFQVGGNFGQSLGPLLAAFIVVPFGQHSVLIFTALALAAVVILTGVSRWYAAIRAGRKKASVPAAAAHPRHVVRRTLFVLIVMLFSKVLYLSSLNSYYTFYLIQTFGVSIQGAQVLLFVFLASVAGGTFLGGPLVDRFGAKFVIWGSILGVLPFTLLLPHLGLIGTVINSIVIGLIISSAFSAMVVYAQELT
ncbi:MAG TPA: MFS transporter, partial [Roseiarcus sp.]|nr:MFS transporter [Roseiarcus sp.]